MDQDDNRIRIVYELGHRGLKSDRVEGISIDCELGLLRERARRSIQGVGFQASVGWRTKVEGLVQAFKLPACGTVEAVEKGLTC